MVEKKTYFKDRHLDADITQPLCDLVQVGFPDVSVVKNPPANAGDTGSIPGAGRFPHAVEQLSPCTATIAPLVQSLGATTTKA